MKHFIMVHPMKKLIEVRSGASLLQTLRATGISMDAPCGGRGSCGKCKVLVNETIQHACQVFIHTDLEVTLLHESKFEVLAEGLEIVAEYDPVKQGFLLAFDIGTTTVAGYLLDQRTGQELALDSIPNPQASYGADVVSRIQYAVKDTENTLTVCIRDALTSMTRRLCRKADISSSQISVVSIVGNSAMQQLFLGICPHNLAAIPFLPMLTEAKTVPAKDVLPCCEHAQILIVPDIAGFIGADTVAGILATRLDGQQSPALLVDIGTNGEMVLCDDGRMVACATAAGPALEGANIQFGMRGAQGAIDHVWLENGQIRYHVIGDVDAVGICGSGLIDAVSVALEAGWINSRGRILDNSRKIILSDTVYLTQQDIRQVQLAKGAIAAGIRLMADDLGLEVADIQKVFLAGAFGTFMNPDSACRIGLLSQEFAGKIIAAGNAAGSGAKLLACNKELFKKTQRLAQRVKHLNLALTPGFQRCFAENMRF